MYATALALEDADGERVVVVNADLCWGSRLIWEAAAAGADLDPSRLIFCGTHTHQGPTHRYGALMYTPFGTANPKSARTSSRRLTDLMSRVVQDAIEDLAPGGVAIVHDVVLGVASNRALPAWRHYTEAERRLFATSGPGADIPDDAPLADRCRDPRLTALVAALQHGSKRCALAWYAVHGTALGPRWPTYSADLWGAARAEAEGEGESLLVGFGGGASGDVTPLPIDEHGWIRRATDRPSEQGRDLAQSVGVRLGSKVREMADAAHPNSFTIGVAHEAWRPRSSHLPAPLSGMATAGGGIDGRSRSWEEVESGVDAPLYRRRRWLRRLIGAGQSPKISMPGAYVPLPLTLGPAFRVVAPRILPLHVLRIGDHVFATVPGEATTMAGWRIERAVARAAGSSSASVIGDAGDYAGYWVTREEYEEER
jgi:neutral ceramidase